MATLSHAQAVKSLNKSAGRRRFVFKNFSQRIDGIDINVYRSLDKHKSDPAEGSCFIRDCLLEWKELNTAEDFISIYDEIMPIVQTLPLVIKHQDVIFEKLCTRLQMKARLSLEPIFRLIASLCRDTLTDFLPFLPRFADSLVSLLKSGADREPEIIEQIFTSWSYMMMYLRENLREKLDIHKVLEDTINLRYYPKDYIQDFMAESMSFLLRTSSEKQLEIGIRKVLLEVANEPLATRKSGASSLVSYVVRRNPSSFHSKARKQLLSLMDNSLFEIGNQINQGSDVIDVVIAAFERLCEELEPGELNLLFKCMYEKIRYCLKSTTAVLSNADTLLLDRLLLLLISSITINNGRRVSDYQPLLELVELLVSRFIGHPDIVKGEAIMSQVVDKILQLLLLVVNGLYISNATSTISTSSLKWAPVFKLRNSSLLNFIRELLQKDPCIVKAFRVHIIRALNDFIETSDDEVMYLLLSLCEKLQVEPRRSNLFDGICEGGFSKLRCYFEQAIENWIGVINNITHSHLSSTQTYEIELAKIWGTISCYPYVLDAQVDSSSLMKLIDSLDQLLKMESDTIAGFSKQSWQSLIAAVLSSDLRLRNGGTFGPAYVSKLLYLAKTYKSSSQVLSAVADCLDTMDRLTLQADTSHKTYDPELKAEKVVCALEVFADSLCHSDKEIRVSTLRILCHYEPMVCESSTMEQPNKKRKSEVSHASTVDSQCINVLEIFLSIESTPLSISSSRNVELLVSRIQTGLSTGRISEAYVVPVLNSLIAVFQNRFSGFWGPASKCLAVHVNLYVGLVWDKFISHLELLQSKLQSSHDKQDKVETDPPNSSSGLVARFNKFSCTASDSTPCAKVLSLLLESLQKIAPIAESRSRQIVPLFLKFLGYSSDNVQSVGSFNSHFCKGKEWKSTLKEWLNLLKLMRNSKAFYQSQFLKEVLLNRLLDENDAEIQMKVLDCLFNWKDNYMLAYDQQLKSLIDSKSLREALTTWSLSKESNLIEEGHRAYLVPMVIRLLMPKVRKLKTLASRKHASVQYRKAVLGFIAQLDVNELPLFFSLLLKPLLISVETDGRTNLFWTSDNNAIDEVSAFNYLKQFSMENIDSLSWKKRYGFLHVVEDLIGVFDQFRIRPFLDLLMGCVVRVLRSCTEHIGNGSSIQENSSVGSASVDEKSSIVATHILNGTSVKQLKDLRSLCLKIVPLVLNKFEDHDFGSEFWNLFFESVKPLIDGFKQEGASSEKPSSLFACFIAMSRSHKLVSLLCREKNLVADIFSMLTVVTASEAIVSCVLKFIENLLTIDNELGEKDSAIRGVLLPNIESLVCSLHGLFQSESVIKRKLVKCPGEVEINIFKLLLKYVNDPSLAWKFVDILLPFLAKKVQNSDVCLEALQVIRDVIPVLGSGSSTKVLNAVSPLLVYADLNTRICICNLLDALAATDPTMLVVATLLRDLNATSAMEIDSLDYDTIVNAYEKIGVDFFYGVKEEHTLAILSHCVYDVSSDEILLRHSAYRALLSFVEFSALIIGGEVKNQQEIPDAMITVDDGYWARPHIHRIVNKFLLKHVGGAVTKETSIKKEWIDLLRDMVFRLPEIENLGSLKDLRDDDAEVDFFNNIVHLQRHRRARALLRFKKFIQERTIPEGIINKVFVPLFFRMMFDVQDQKNEHVKNACVEALASISGRVEWKSYYGLLVRCFREMSKRPDKQKVLMRLVCSIFDHFHFTESGSGQESTDTTNEASHDVTSGSSLAISRKCSSSIMISEIQICLQKTILPKIQKLLGDSSDKVNVNISLASLKLLKLLPGDIMDSQLPSIIHRVSNFLKNRLESIRDEARSALAACLKELGLEYLQFIVKVLRSTLKRGYEMHVLGYTVNFLLTKSLPDSISGKLDYCLQDLLFIVENDILGDVAEEKEVDKIASKMKETRKCKSFETLKLIAQNITFRSHALKLLSPVTTNLQKHMTPKVKTKLESMLSHIAAGIESNVSIDQKDLFIFLYGLIEDGINGETGQGEKSTAESIKYQGNDTNKKRIASARVISTAPAPRCSHLITVFSLGVLHNRIRNLKLDENYEQQLSMLDPFVILLGKCLSSKYEDVLSASLRCLAPLVRLPLPSLEPQAETIKAALLDIAHSTVNATSPLMQSCLRLLTVLLRSTKITLSKDQLHMIIHFPLFVDLERNPCFLALSLMKAIVNRKLVVPEIYDVANRVQELMVKSQVEPIRKRCSQILLQFLLDYPLGKRLQQHLDFLLENLSYVHSTGKEAVLEMLHVIIIKFPKSVVDEQSKAFFMPLVLCLTNDQDSKVRSMAGAAIKLLLRRIHSKNLNSFIEDSLMWYSDGKPQLQSAAAQILGLLVEVMKEGFEGQIKRVLPVLRTKLQSVVLVTDKELESSDETPAPFWKEAYYSLVLLEKILQQFPVWHLNKDLEDIWEAVCDLLLHPHVWLRNISTRLLGIYFDNVIESSGGNLEKLGEVNLEKLGSFHLMKPSRLFMVAVSLCCQLKTQVAEIDDTSCYLITKNLFLAIYYVHSLMGRVECLDPCKVWAALEQHEQNRFLKGFQLLDAGKGKAIFLSVISGGQAQEQNGDFRSMLVSFLLRRMGKIALQTEFNQMKIVFNCFQKVTANIREEDARLHYASIMLLPLYKVCEGFAGKVIAENSKQSAQEVCGAIRNALGIQNFVQIYNKIRKNLKAKRDKRRQEEKVMAVVNPERNAKRKLKIAAKHKVNKKRKIMTMKMGRWMH